jgi:hypothetical protein
MIHGQNLSSILGEPVFVAHYCISLKFHPPARTWYGFGKIMKDAIENTLLYFEEKLNFLPISCGGSSWERVDLLTIDWIPASVFTTVATYTSQS